MNRHFLITCLALGLALFATLAQASDREGISPNTAEEVRRLGAAMEASLAAVDRAEHRRAMEPTLHLILFYVHEILDQARMSRDDRAVQHVACQAVLVYERVLPRRVRNTNPVDDEDRADFRGVGCDPRCLLALNQEIPVRRLRRAAR